MPSDRERTEYHSMKQSLMMLIEECDRLVKLPKEISAEIDFSMNTVELQMPFGNGMTLSPNSPSLAVMNRMCSYVLEVRILAKRRGEMEINFLGTRPQLERLVTRKNFHTRCQSFHQRSSRQSSPQTFSCTNYYSCKTKRIVQSFIKQPVCKQLNSFT